MAIRQFVLAEEGEDPSKKRLEQLDEQIKQTQETLKQAKETDPKSERVFNMQQRVNTLKTQKDRLKKRMDDRAENDKEESKLFTEDEVRARARKAMASPCKKHGKAGCESTLCPESPNFNVLTTI